MKEQKTISGKVYYAVLHSRKPLDLDEVTKLSGLEKEKVSQKLHELKRQGFLRKNENKSWEVALK